MASHALPSLALSIVFLSTLSTAERNAPDCPTSGDLIAEFDVHGRAAIRDAIPHIGMAPELTAGGIVEDGSDHVPPDGSYHLVLYRCVPGGFLPILGRPPRGPSPVLYGVLRITSPTGFDIYYAGVDFADLRVSGP